MEGEKQVVYSSLHRRILAAAIDLFIMMIVCSVLAAPVYDKIYQGRTIDVIVAELQAEVGEGNDIPASLILETLAKERFFSKFFLMQAYVILLMAIYTFVFWHFYSATPGKFFLGCKIVNYKFEKPTTFQFIMRIIGYGFSMLPFFLGFIMVSWTKDSQGLHDKFARTFVVNVRRDFKFFSQVNEKFDKIMRKQKI